MKFELILNDFFEWTNEQQPNEQQPNKKQKNKKQKIDQLKIKANELMNMLKSKCNQHKLIDDLLNEIRFKVQQIQDENDLNEQNNVLNEIKLKFKHLDDETEHKMSPDQQQQLNDLNETINEIELKLKCNEIKQKMTAPCTSLEQRFKDLKEIQTEFEPIKMRLSNDQVDDFNDLDEDLNEQINLIGQLIDDVKKLNGEIKGKLNKKEPMKCNDLNDVNKQIEFELKQMNDVKQKFENLNSKFDEISDEPIKCNEFDQLKMLFDQMTSRSNDRIKQLQNEKSEIQASNEQLNEVQNLIDSIEFPLPQPDGSTLNDCESIVLITEKIREKIEPKLNNLNSKDKQKAKIQLDNLKARISSVQKSIENQIHNDIDDLMNDFNEQQKFVEEINLVPNLDLNDLNDLIGRLNDAANHMTKQQQQLNRLHNALNHVIKWNDSVEFQNKLMSLIQKWKSICDSINEMLVQLNEVTSQWSQFNEEQNKILNELNSLLNQLNQNVSFDDLNLIQLKANEIDVHKLHSIASRDPLKRFIESDFQTFNTQVNQLKQEIQTKIDYLFNLENDIKSLDKCLREIHTQINQCDSFDGQTFELLNDKLNQLNSSLNKLETQCPNDKLNDVKMMIQNCNDLMQKKLLIYNEINDLNEQFLVQVNHVMDEMESIKRQIELSKTRDLNDALSLINIELTGNLNQIKTQLKQIDEIKTLINSKTKTRRNSMETTLKLIKNELKLIEIQLNQRQKQLNDSIDKTNEFSQLKSKLINWISAVQSLIDQKSNLKSLKSMKSHLKALKNLKKEFNKNDLKDLNELIIEIQSNQCQCEDIKLEFNEIEQQVNKTELKLKEEIEIFNEFIEEWQQFDGKINDIEKWIQKCEKTDEKPTTKEQFNQKQVKIIFVY